jgi:zinc transport system substrate-binding protein
MLGKLRLQWYSLPLLICFFSLQTAVAAQLKDTVFVSILPQKMFVQQISGDSLNIEVMVQPGASPATYEPKPSQMRKLASSSAYFAIGVPFENAWLDRIGGVNPEMEIIHTDQGIEKVAMVSHNHDAHADEHDHDAHADEHDHDVHVDEHDHDDGLDPHIWLSPVLVKKQAANITTGLIKLFPENTALFQSNFRLFERRLDTLHAEMNKQLLPYRGKQFMVFHPSWGYFAREYGLVQVAIEIEGKSPKPAQVSEFIKQARKDGIRIIFAQKQFSTKNAQVIAQAIGGEVVLVDPLAEDLFSNMHEIAQKFQEALQ